MTLSKRLAAVAEAALPGLVLADIGTDHAYLPVSLIKNGVIPAALACDIRTGPLERAKKTVVSAGLLDRVALRLGPGLAPLKDREAAQVVIAGMGGEMIAHILSEDPVKARQFVRLILQPMSRSSVLRTHLLKNHFKIIEERVVRDNGKFYPVIVAEPGEMAPLTVHELEFGAACVTRRDTDYTAFLEYKRARYQHIIAQMADSPQACQRRAACVEALTYINTLL